MGTKKWEALEMFSLNELHGLEEILDELVSSDLPEFKQQRPVYREVLESVHEEAKIREGNKS